MSGLPGINFFGSFSGNMGLAVAARLWIRALHEAGAPLHAVDVPDPSGRSDHDTSFDAISRALDEPAPHAVNFLSMNPPCLARLLREGHEALDVERCTNVILPFWELERLPSDWLPTLPVVDLVVASTRFVAEAFEKQPDGPPVTYLPLPFRLDEQPPPDRARWGIPDDAFLLVSAFELASDSERKNPWAALEAFGRAFPDEPRARLLLKLNNAHMHDGFPETRERLAEAVARDPRIVVVDETLAYRDVLALYAGADAFVSLHRAEGLGLGPLESMALGTPVIATAWSGNLDYMTEENSCLVDFTLVPVRAATQRAYEPERVGPDARWADPNVDTAAAWMRRLFDDAVFARTLGERAAADVARRSDGIALDAFWSALRANARD